jgi:hypothetical protein
MKGRLLIDTTLVLPLVANAIVRFAIAQGWPWPAQKPRHYVLITKA